MIRGSIVIPLEKKLASTNTVELILGCTVRIILWNGVPEEGQKSDGALLGPYQTQEHCSFSGWGVPLRWLRVFGWGRILCVREMEAPLQAIKFLTCSGPIWKW
jgi:hypothetical protein